jgi:hypothetical protein
MDKFISLVGILQIIVTKVFESTYMVKGMVTYPVASVQHHLEFLGVLPDIVAHHEEGSLDLVLIQ